MRLSKKQRFATAAKDAVVACGKIKKRQKIKRCVQ
jgi:hypothetical protein